jgi:hypothetical protein
VAVGAQRAGVELGAGAAIVAVVVVGVSARVLAAGRIGRRGRRQQLRDTQYADSQLQRDYIFH